MSSDKEMNLAKFFGWTLFSVLVLSFLFGAALLPLRTPNEGATSWWQAICRAVGIPIEDVPPASNAKITNTFIWSPAFAQRVQQANLQNGRDLYQTCAPCHDAQNRSTEPLFPLIDGMTARPFLKQIYDYATGVRSSPIMMPIAQGLSEKDAIDLAAFIASMPRPVVQASAAETAPNSPAFRLIHFGDPGRGIAPCASCHGPDGAVPDAPPIHGLSVAYLRKQLDDFAQGLRRNDLYSAMRSISRRLTDRERTELARYYARSPQQVGSVQ